MTAAWVWRVRVATVVIVAVVLGAGARVSRASAAPPPVPHAFSERPNRDVQIRVWRQALAADSTSAIALGQLAALHLQRAREGGTFDDYLQAEAFARRSLARRTQRNGQTAATLVTILMAQHRFVEASAMAESLVVREPDVPEYRAALGEVAMELGDDALADRMFRSVWGERRTLTIAARLARWLEVTNHVADARVLLTKARDDAMARRDVARETKAWFALRLGDLELRAGRVRAAEAAFTEGLQIEPGDARLLAAMARLAAARGEPENVIRWGEAAIAAQLDPATLGLIGDAYAASGDAAHAAEYLRTLEVAVSLQPGAYHRAWSLHLLDHRMRVDEVLTRAQQELSTRKDVYGWDVVAWALHQAGRDAEARVAMQQALRLGTPDPLLRRHAEAIGVSVPSSAGGV